MKTTVKKNLTVQEREMMKTVEEKKSEILDRGYHIYKIYKKNDDYDIVCAKSKKRIYECYHPDFQSSKIEELDWEATMTLNERGGNDWLPEKTFAEECYYEVVNVLLQNEKGDVYIVSQVA